VWRKIVVLAFSTVLVGLLALACGGGEDHRVCSFVPGSTPPPSDQPLPVVSLEEARGLVDFEIVLPTELPAGAHVEGVLLHRFCPSSRFPVDVNFTGGAYPFTITELRGELSLGGPSEPIHVGEFFGEIQRTPRTQAPNLVSISWRRGDMSYIATAFPQGTFTESEFLRILASIP
jgi:hypothetical protein